MSKPTSSKKSDGSEKWTLKRSNASARKYKQAQDEEPQKAESSEKTSLSLSKQASSSESNNVLRRRNANVHELIRPKKRQKTHEEIEKPVAAVNPSISIKKSKPSPKETAEKVKLANEIWKNNPPNTKTDSKENSKPKVKKKTPKSKAKVKWAEPLVRFQEQEKPDATSRF